MSEEAQKQDGKKGRDAVLFSHDKIFHFILCSSASTHALVLQLRVDGDAGGGVVVGCWWSGG